MLASAPFGLQVFFAVLPAIVMALIVWGIVRTIRAQDLETGVRRRQIALAVLGGVAWYVVAVGLGASGVMLSDDGAVPVVMRAVMPMFLLATWLAFSPLGTRMIRTLPMAAVIGFQGFRVFVELGMHKAYEVGIMPVQMSYSGWNFDIVTGLSALVVAGLVARRPSVRLIAAWNVLGSGLLLAIVLISIVSTPRFHAFGALPEQMNTWVMYAPFSTLPCLMVPAALLGHLLVWRWLAVQRQETARVNRKTALSL